jgi:hypothetical protein
MKLRGFFITFALFASSLCYVYGYLHETENAIYTGMRSINASDYSTHLSWIDQSREGYFFLQNKFTAEPQGGDFVRPVYFLLSQSFRLTDLSNPAVFHIFRIVCGAILLILLFPMLKRFDSDPAIVLRAFLLLVFTSGLGFLTKQLIPSADLDISEATLFVSLGEAPHFLYSLLFLWAGIACFFAGVQSLYFVCLLFLWWEHPFEAVILIAVCTANLWMIKSRKTQILFLLITAGISIPPFLYYQHLQKLPAFAGWGSAQNLMISPPFYSYLSAFLPLLILAFFGVRALLKHSDRRAMMIFLLIWMVVQFVLAYLPFPFQRRLIAGVQFPMALLAAHGLIQIQKPLIQGLLILIFSAGNMVLMSRWIDELKPRQMPYYLSSSYDEAFQWLADHEDKGGVIVSGFVTGNLIPGFTGFTSCHGHSSLTPEVAKKRTEVAEFYQDPTTSFLLKNRIRYVFWGLEERHFSGPDLRERFGTVFENEQVAILDPRLKIEGMNIVVGGHSRNIGKTSVMAGIIRGTQEKKWTAMKITQFGHGICSTGRECHCSTEQHKYVIQEERDPKGRGDTCRFLAAGASRSVWVRTKQGMLFEAMPAVQHILKEQQNTIIESNSILEFFKPDLYLVVLDYSVSDFKASAKKFLDRSDACIIVRSRSSTPAWKDVSPRSISGKRVFEVTPPAYGSVEILNFVRDHSAS